MIRDVGREFGLCPCPWCWKQPYRCLEGVLEERIRKLSAAVEVKERTQERLVNIEKEVNRMQEQKKRKTRNMEEEEEQGNATPHKKRKILGKDNDVHRSGMSLHCQPIAHRAGNEDSRPHHHPSFHQDDGGVEPSREQWSRPHHHPINAFCLKDLSGIAE